MGAHHYSCDPLSRGRSGAFIGDDEEEVLDLDSLLKLQSSANSTPVINHSKASVHYNAVSHYNNSF
jgi:hypothetical protein